MLLTNYSTCPARPDPDLRNAFWQLSLGMLGPPDILSAIHLYGGSSGRPVFNEKGHVFGIASGIKLTVH